MKSLRFYDQATGLFAARTMLASDDVDVVANTPPGLIAIEGEFDHLSQRVDVETGKVVDYQPPQPSPDHEWNADAKRWQLTAPAQAAIEAAMQAKATIAVEEAGSIRALRELILDPTNTAARAKLQAADTAIAAVRVDLIATVQDVKP
jgi:hypothetical protein